MSLSIYEDPTPGAAFSEDQLFTNPLSLTVNGITGAVVTRRYYIRNEDNTKFFTNIRLTTTAGDGEDIISGSLSGFVWKLIAGDAEPVEAQWVGVGGGNEITLSDIGSSGNGDITTYLPFWLRIEVPRSVQVRSFQNVQLELNAEENTV